MPVKSRTKEIILSHVYQPDPTSVFVEHKMYHVSLGNGTRKIFKNLKHADAYLRYCSIKLNNIAYQVNDIFAETLAYVQKKWMVLTQHEFKMIDKMCSDIKQIFHRLYSRQYSMNYNYYVFSWLDSIISSIKSLIRELIRILRSSSKLDNWPHKEYIAQLNVCRNDINTSPKNIQDIQSTVKSIL